MADPCYFKRVKISPSATIKMMMHGQSGVEKGIKRGGKPIEVMGLLLGRPDVDDPHCLIISDAQALPIEGFETRVLTDDDAVLNYMFTLQEMNEFTRKEIFCGWYHTHPFDVDVNSHCFLSNTDISTQLAWQRAEDAHSPWLAIVIDPLRSLAKERPELAAFRVYPPDYSPPPNLTPDGTYVTDDRARVEKWGACWHRYYKLDVSYYMSSLAQSTLGILKNNFLWQNVFTSTPTLEPEHQQRLAERISGVSKSLESFDGSHGRSMSMLRSVMGGEGLSSDTGLGVGAGGGGGGGGGAGLLSGGVSQGSGGGGREDSVFAKTQGVVSELVVEQCQASISQLAKSRIFLSNSSAGPMDTDI